MAMSYADVFKKNLSRERNSFTNLYIDPERKFPCGSITDGVVILNATAPYSGKLTLYSEQGEVACIKTSLSCGTVSVDHVSVSREYQGMGIATKLVSSLSNQQIAMEASCYDTSFGLFERLGFRNTSKVVTRVDGHYKFGGMRKMVLEGSKLNAPATPPSRAQLEKVGWHGHIEHVPAPPQNEAQRENEMEMSFDEIFESRGLARLETYISYL
jgi:GNAT superfamily N-acetyltransferase